jgi:hypothetical protein
MSVLAPDRFCDRLLVSDVVDRVLAALNAHDLEAFVACYDENATIEDGDGNVLARGRSEIRSRYGPILAAFPSLRVEALSRQQAGRYVVQEETVAGRAPEEERHLAVYQLEGNAIVRERLLR